MHTVSTHSSAACPSNPDTRAFSSQCSPRQKFDSDEQVECHKVSTMYASKLSFSPSPLINSFQPDTFAPSSQCSTTPTSLTATSKWDVSKVYHVSQCMLPSPTVSSPSNPGHGASLSSQCSNAYQFNSNVSNWKIKNGTALPKCFVAHDLSTQRFFGSILERPKSHLPWRNMFPGTCSRDPPCGTCGRVDTNGRSVLCHPTKECFRGQNMPLLADYGPNAAPTCPRGSFVTEDSANLVRWAFSKISPW